MGDEWWKREELISIRQAALLEGVSRQSVYAWVRAGIRGVRLEAVRKRGRLHTSQARVQAFNRLQPVQPLVVDGAPARRRHVKQEEGRP